MLFLILKVLLLMKQVKLHNRFILYYVQVFPSHIKYKLN